MKRLIRTVIALVVMMCLLTVSVQAANLFVPYDSYVYNEFDEAVAVPAGYVPTQILDAARLGISVPLDSVTDIVYKNGTVYILDSGNSRILALDEDYKVIRVYDDFKLKEEKREELSSVFTDGKVVFTGAEGFAVSDDGNFYIADTLSNRVICADSEGQIFAAVTRPDKALNNTAAAFDPTKVAVDSKNRIYVAAKSIALGLMVFDSNGDFLYFFGANEVLSTTQALLKAFRDVFYSVTQMEFVEQATPVTITNLDFDENDFLYTVSPYRDAEASGPVAGLIRKLNYEGNDILDSEVVFGDLETGERKTWFSDVDIDSQGFINMLDETRGRIFQYTDSGMLVAVFGSMGDQVGCFTSPSALESVGNDILVCDRKKNCVFVFSPTEYGTAVRNAILKMNNNDLDGSINEWNSLLEQNSNCYQAYLGLGRIYDNQGDYKTAMKYFKLAYAQEEYAEAFRQNRQIIIEDNILLMLAAVIVLIVAVYFAIRALKRFAAPIEGSAYTKMESKYTLPFYSLMHPNDGFAQFKTRNITSMRFSFMVVLSWLIIKIIDYNFTGFSFSINRNSDFNMPIMLALTFGIFVIFVISNWVVACLFEGKGTARDIIATVAYSLIPYITAQLIGVLLTNILVPSEAVFIEIINVIGTLWTVAVMFLGLMTIHEYSVGKTVWSILLTLVGMIIVVFLIILLYSLINQLFDFILSVYKEIIFRT